MNELSLPLGQVQKIYSTAHFVCLGIFDGRKRNFLYLGRGSGHEGVGLGEGFPAAGLRCKDKFLEYLRAHLENKNILRWKKDELDRLLLLECHDKSIFVFFWRGPLLYFLHSFTKDSKARLFRSWRSFEKSELESWEKVRGDNELFSLFDEVGRSPHEGSLFSKMTISQYFEEQKEREEELGLRSGRKKFFERKIERIENDLKKVQDWPLLMKEAQEREDYAEKNLLYEKAKRLKAAQNLLQKRLDETLGEREKEKNSKKHESVELKIITPVWGKAEEKKATSGREVLKKSEIEIFQWKGISLAVGLSASGNDYLRREWGKKEDWWFHMEGERSAHVIAKVQNLSDLTEELFEVVAGLIHDYSQTSFEEIPVIFSQVKNLKGIKGAKGAVTIAKPRYRRIPYRKDWKLKVSFPT